ncbi:MAG: hypothetical protein GQ583_09930 [Methyloprofundus sp.]|nr:hypothetical protein [Methyloprofundus sp.]
MSANTPPLEHNDAAVLQHMAMYQSIISRMANNSSACKNWSIVLVSAFLAFVIEKGKGDIAWLGMIPIVIFWFLDASYLALEKKFRAAAKVSADKIHASNFKLVDLFVVEVDGKIPAQLYKGFFSWATWPVYGGLLVLLLLAMLWGM